MITQPNQFVSDRQLMDNEIHIYVSRLDELALPPGWETTLGRADLERAARFHFDRDRDRFLQRRFMLRTILSAYLNISAQDIVFEFSPHGKPYLARNPVHFNVSESAGRCALAFSRHSPLGVDIEHIRPHPDLPLIALQYFSIAEQSALAGMNPESRLAAFYHIWTQKEAFIKAIEFGLSLSLNAFEVQPYPDCAAGLVAIHGFPNLEAEWKMQSLLLFNGFRLAVCYSSGLSNVQVISDNSGFVQK
jgi:4'-phosphopantetheinyl transferase